MCNDIVRYYMMSGIGILSVVDPPQLVYTFDQIFVEVDLA